MALHLPTKASGILAEQPMQLISLETGSEKDVIGFEITELRMWQCCLNKAIISDNYNVPLTILYEKKRRLKVDI